MIDSLIQLKAKVTIEKIKQNIIRDYDTLKEGYLKAS